MKCPYCAHLGDKVVDSRESREGEVIRRRRECLGCGKRFTSYERIDEIPYMVVKKDGTHERFEGQTANHPQSGAVRAGSESFTYGELNDRANRLAHKLRELGVAPESSRANPFRAFVRSAPTA